MLREVYYNSYIVDILRINNDDWNGVECRCLLSDCISNISKCILQNYVQTMTHNSRTHAT